MVFSPFDQVVYTVLVLVTILVLLYGVVTVLVLLYVLMIGITVVVVVTSYTAPLLFSSTVDVVDVDSPSSLATIFQSEYQTTGSNAVSE